MQLRQLSRRTLLAGTLSAGALLTSLLAPTTHVSAQPHQPTAEVRTPGAVYALTNEPNGNRVIVYNRAANGVLTQGNAFSTGGMGSGQFEGSAGGLILSGQSPDNLSGGNHYLIATNTGSNEISVFTVKKDELTLTTKVPSGGMQPVSVTLRKNLVYVLNQASGNIQGYTLSGRGELTPIPGSNRPVTGGGPADTAMIAFTPDGNVLVVTGKNSNVIDTYLVGKDGIASAPIPNASTGVTPFGFAFTQTGNLVVAESFQGAMGQGAASFYKVPNDGVLVPLSGPVRNNRSDTCWVVITDNNKYAYVTNAMSGDVSSYRVGSDGVLTLLQAIAGTTGPVTTDEALSSNSHYLYVRTVNDGKITSFEVQQDGTLTPLQVIGGLPPGAIGLAVK